MSQLELLERQARGTVQNQVRAAEADIRRSTSIVSQAHKLFMPVRTVPVVKKTVRRKSGVYTVVEEPALLAQDGYVRRSPVQELRVDVGYKKRLIRRAVVVTFGVLIIVLLIYVLFDVIKLI